MPAPYNHGCPVRRIGAILTCTEYGDADNGGFTVTFLSEQGNNIAFDLPLSTPTELGALCLPSSATIMDVSEESLIQHARMAGWIDGAGNGKIPGSLEWLALMQEGGSIPDFQTPIGNARIYGARAVNDTQFAFDIRKKNTGATRTIQTDYSIFLNYTLDPTEAMRMIGGAVKYLHPTYVHNPATGTYLTQNQKDTVIASILAPINGIFGINSLWM